MNEYQSRDLVTNFLIHHLVAHWSELLRLYDLDPSDLDTLEYVWKLISNGYMQRWEARIDSRKIRGKTDPDVGE